jgi:hypothetical protein
VAWVDQRLGGQRNRMETNAATMTKVFHLSQASHPDLRKTLNKCLTSLEPVVCEDELRGACHFIPRGMLFARSGRMSSTGDWRGSSSGKFGTKIVTVLDRFSPNNWLDNLRAGTTFWQVQRTAWPDYQ